MAKDPLCPLGFHPQVRWPTRCKRCFREYKEHSSKKDEPVERVSFIKNESEKSEATQLTPDKKDYSSPYSSISTAALNRLTKVRIDDPTKKLGFAGVDTRLTPPDFGSSLRRNTTDLSEFLETGGSSDVVAHHLSPTDASVTVRLRKSSSFNDESYKNSELDREETPPRSVTPTPIPTFKLTEDSSPSASPKPIPKGRNGERKSSSEDSGGAGNLGDGSPTIAPKKKTKRKRLLIKGVQEVVPDSVGSFDGSDSPDADGSIDNSSADVAFIIQVKSTRKKKLDDEETMSMTTATDTTDTTLIDVNESQNSSGLSLWEFEELKKELERLKEKCDKLEKEKGDILSRRVSSLEAPKIQSTEYLKLQQKLNQLTTLNEDLKEEQKHLELRNRELEKELAARPTGDFFQRCISELRSKLANAEAEIEKLHEEKRETEQQMNEMQDEFEELQDSFQGDKSEEYAVIKKELDDSNKSCRVLQFKLRKSDKRIDTLEAEKKELENTIEKTKNISKIIQLEEELAKSRAEIEKLLNESFKYKKNEGQTSPRLAGVIKKKSPVLTKAPSGEFVDPPISGGLDPEQLLRDLQSTVERESDLREQLKFAEEEVTSLRQKMSRIEEENESLLIQIKKISTPVKTKVDTQTGKGNLKQSKGPAGPGTPATTSPPENSAELKLQLELNEQECRILRRKLEEMEKTNNELARDLQSAQDKLETCQNDMAKSITKSKNVEEVSILRRKIIEKEREVERLEAELQASKAKSKMNRPKPLESEESKAEVRRLNDEINKVKVETAGQTKILESEIEKIKADLEIRENRIGQLNESNKTLLGHVEKFKRDIGTMKEHYEAIQDDFVLKNANLIADKERLQSSLSSIRNDTDTLENELKAVRETFNNRQDIWIKEKLALQDRMAELQSKHSNISGESWENPQLKKLVKDQTIELENKRREVQGYKDQIVFMQRENDELRKQLEDFEKVSQVQIRSISNEPTVKSDKEIKAVRERLQSEDKLHKNEIAQMKMRLDQEVASKSEEISTIQNQLSRAKRERDTFRQMVDSAQRAIAELKSKDSYHRRESISGLEEAAEGARAAVNTLQERVQALEDELSESRRETARCKTELATENSTWEMKLAQMQQKVNELEEDRLLGSGRSRAAGQKTRLELAWQKERDEQQRRLKEATTLARDLKTTLQEIERERDREKIESRRRLEQLKSALDEEQEELRRKVGESHADLLELRDAHAKLRTANEKLRRDREKLEKDREIQLKKELEQRRIGQEREKLLDELMQRLGPSASLESSTGVQNFVQNMRLLQDGNTPNGSNPTAQARRSGFRRVASAEADSASRDSISISSSAYGKEHYGVAGGVGRTAMKYASGASSTLTLPSEGLNGRGSQSTESGTSKDKLNAPQGNLYRKSLSLEQNVSMPDEQRIWKGESEAGSGSSLKSLTSLDSRGSSVDRFSTISSKSEKPKSKSLVSKMKKLVKSKSIEESQTVTRIGVETAGVGVRQAPAGQKSDSISSLTSDHEKDGSGKVRLKDKVKGMFRRSSRSPSAERTRSAGLPEPPTRPSRESTPKKDSAPPSLQRPLIAADAGSMQRPLQPSQPSSSSTQPQKRLN